MSEAVHKSVFWALFSVFILAAVQFASNAFGVPAFDYSPYTIFARTVGEIKAALVAFSAENQACLHWGGQSPAMAGVMELACNTGLTSVRVIIAVGAGMTLGIAVGLTMFLSLRPMPVFAGLLLAARGVPLLALIPLFTYWFGDSELFGVIGYIAYATFAFIASAAYDIACKSNVEHEQLLFVAKESNQSCFRIIGAVLVPIVMFRIRATALQVIGYSWAFAIGAELVVTKGGLGALLWKAYENSNLTQMILLAVIYIVLGFASVAVMRRVLFDLAGEEVMPLSAQPT